MKTKENVRISKNCLKKTKRFQKKVIILIFCVIQKEIQKKKKKVGSNKRGD